MNSTVVHRCLVAGFFANVAKLSPDGRYRTVRDSTVVAIHPSSVLAHFGSPPEWILFNEISKTSQLFARDVSVIDPRYSHFRFELYAIVYSALPPCRNGTTRVWKHKILTIVSKGFVLGWAGA